MGTPAVLVAILLATAVQFAFTYAPVMHTLFQSRPLALQDGVAIVLIGIVLMLALEGEKALLHRLRIFGELS
jgi:hypothetical protein